MNTWWWTRWDPVRLCKTIKATVPLQANSIIISIMPFRAPRAPTLLTLYQSSVLNYTDGFSIVDGITSKQVPKTELNMTDACKV